MKCDKNLNNETIIKVQLNRVKHCFTFHCTSSDYRISDHLENRWVLLQKSGTNSQKQNLWGIIYLFESPHLREARVVFASSRGTPSSTIPWIRFSSSRSNGLSNAAPNFPFICGGFSGISSGYRKARGGANFNALRKLSRADSAFCKFWVF